MVEVTIDSLMAGLGGFPGLGGSSLFNLVAFTAALVIYAIFVWKFHGYIGKRDIFSWDTEKFERAGGLGKLGHGLAYFVKYLIAFPVMAFVWFGVFGAFMFVLSTGFEVQKILLISFSLVTAIRVCAYYNEKLSLELAKLLPLNLLVIYIIQPSAFNFSAVERAMDLGSFAGVLVTFFLFSVLAEWVIRILWSIKRKLSPHVHPELDTVERFGR